MALALLWLIAAASGPVPDIAVVCPREFQQPLQPWLEYRRSQGHTIAIVAAGQPATAIRQEIRAIAKAGGLQFVVLVGDTDHSFGRDPVCFQRSIPCHYCTAEVNVHWGSEPQLATDNWFADLDDDNVPDVAIGRLPAGTPEQLAQVIQKILAYEQSTDFGPWRRQLHFVAGVGGFGALTDTIIEAASRHFILRGVPETYRFSMTYASWRSPYCPPLDQFHETAVERLNEGSLLWIYMGHGQRHGLDSVPTTAGPRPILSVSDMAKLQSRHGSPIALFLACYAGAFDAADECLGECMLRQPGGPVAVLAGSRVTMPYAMCVMANELSQRCFRDRCPTLGEAVLRSKQNMLKAPGPGDDARAVLDALAAAFSPLPDKLQQERAEHVLMFNLLGDPLLRLRYPKAITGLTVSDVQPSGTFVVEGTSPVGGRCTMELVAAPGALTFAPPPRSGSPLSPEKLAEFLEVYHRANDDRLSVSEFTTAPGWFSAAMQAPPETNENCRVRVYVEGDADFAAGAIAVRTRKAAPGGGQ